MGTKEERDEYPKFTKIQALEWENVKCCMCGKKAQDKEIFDCMDVNPKNRFYYCTFCAMVFRAVLKESDFGSEDWNSLTNF